MLKKKIVILGGGLAGLSAAWHLRKKGIKSVIYEKEPESGGLCRSKIVKGFTFDYDGHLLHFRDQYVLDLIRNELGLELKQHERSSWVYSFGRYIPYPFQANLCFLPPKIASRCLKDFIKVSSNNTSRNKYRNFHTWVKNSFGEGISRHFMFPYNRKFWGYPLNKMNCEWVDSFIPKPRLSDLALSYLSKEGKGLGYNSTFWYPAKGGINQLPQALERKHCKVYKKCQVDKIDLDKKQITFNGKERDSFDVLISTIPLPELARIVSPLPPRILNYLGLLRWNSIFNLNLGLSRVFHKNMHWVYFPEASDIFFRAGFPHNFGNRIVPSNRSSVYVEVSYRNSLSKNNLAPRIINNLKSKGLLESESDILAKDINNIKYGYPIYDLNYLKARNNISSFFLNQDVILCGRYGSWKYMSMEDAILDGKRVADQMKI